MSRQSRIQAILQRFTIRLMLGLMLFSTFSSALALSVSAADSGSSWTFCATEGDFCDFSGTKEVRYGADYTSSYNFTTGFFTDGTYCTTVAIGHGDPANGTVKSCYTRDVRLDSGAMTTVVSNLHKTVTVTFNVYAGQSGTDEDLKSKITVKRSGQDYFAELGEEDTVANLDSSDTSSTLIIHLDQALVGVGNTIRIGSGAFLNADDDAYEETVEIGPIVFEAPGLTADTTDNNNKQPITITFNDDALWRQAITEVWDGGSLLKGTDYNVSEGAIMLNAGVLVSGNHTLKVKASGYADASVSQPVNHLFSGSGTGTQSDPYQIATPGQLIEIRDLNANNTYFKLVDNIDLSGYSNWNPIGPDDSSQFRGVLDGNGFKITNLMITSDANFRGLFGFVAATGQLMNIRLEQVSISTAGYYYTGGLAAVNYGTISNSSVTGKVTGNYNTGGLAGLNGGTITKSYSEAEVKGFTFTGGLVGQNQGTVTNSYATGDLSQTYNGPDYSGGLIGYSTSGSVSNSYATGNVVTSERSGGLIGLSDWTSVTASYYDSETTHQSDSGKGEGQSTADMRNQAKYSGWDFTSTWFMGTDSYPQLWVAVGLSQGTEGGTTKLEHVASGLEYSLDDDDYYLIEGSVADNIAAVAGNEITVRMISNPSIKRTLIVRLPDLHPGDAPETAALEVGTIAGTTNLIGVSEGMEYKVNDGSYEEILDTTTDDIAVNAGDQISVRQAASTSAPATLAQVLTVALTDIKPAAAPTTGELEPGTVGGTTKLIDVSAAMEYKVNEGSYQTVEGTSVDNIHAGVGGTISVRVAATALQPASETQVLTVQSSEANPLSADAKLSGLTLSGATLSPEFDSGTLVYTAKVPNNVTSTTVAATALEANATVTAADLGAKSLVVGENVITVHVTAQDGSTKSEYKVTVTRASLPVLGGGVPSPTEDSIIVSTDGTLTLPNGRTGRVSQGDGVTIFIPKGAISQELRLTIEKITDALILITTKDKLASAVFEIQKNFTENFSSPVTLTFTFDPTSVGGKQTVAIFYYDEVKKIWVEVGGQVSGNKISAEVNHFTKYAVFVVGEDDQEKTELVTFSDIAGHWAEVSIKQALKDGIVKGYSDGTFKPSKSVTRAEFAVMLANALKLQVAATEPSFKDASQIGAWAKAAVAQAQQAGLIRGGSDGSFRPNDVITRAEMAAMIERAMGQAAEAVQTTGFADEESIPVWAKDSIAYVKEKGIMQGKGGNKFAPKDLTTRAEAVTVLLNMLANKNK